MDELVFRVLLTSRSDRDPASAHRRLARVLKALGRAHGFVNLGVELLPTDKNLDAEPDEKGIQIVDTPSGPEEKVSTE